MHFIVCHTINLNGLRHHYVTCLLSCFETMLGMFTCIPYTNNVCPVPMSLPLWTWGYSILVSSLSPPLPHRLSSMIMIKAVGVRDWKQCSWLLLVSFPDPPPAFDQHPFCHPYVVYQSANNTEHAVHTPWTCQPKSCLDFTISCTYCMLSIVSFATTSCADNWIWRCKHKKCGIWRQVTRCWTPECGQETTIVY